MVLILVVEHWTSFLIVSRLPNMHGSLPNESTCFVDLRFGI